MQEITSEIISLIRDLYPNKTRVGLHEPIFDEAEKNYLSKCIDSTFVSSVGEYVGQFEKKISSYTGVAHAIATSNGTSALHVSLVVAGVQPEDEVITQALTFVATANAISYCFAKPIFIDSDQETLGMSPEKLEEFLSENAEIRNDGFCYNKVTQKKIRACVPMHVFGHPCKIEKIAEICARYNLFLIEDAAEALGSFQGSKHIGRHGKLSVLSFNGNKIVTCGGGGMVITDDPALAARVKHLTTTAKVPHTWEFVHDEVGYNYRMPNLNAALACAQMEKIEYFLKDKREIAMTYKSFFADKGVVFVDEPLGSKANFWLNAILFPNANEKQKFLEVSNANGVMTRPVWALMTDLEMYKMCQQTTLDVARSFYNCLVNIPSGVRNK